ncbi:hypothetical protein C3941_09480 [Kaistia algarum]|uniref:SGNH/GDSL hydrolase family protein n=1 Tax=Kaistia algarum TaxID=2083279 RepID=UPI000CE74295|nr:SGNH/GDSL hydrolase family protein [Kaistia algarum]MCX5512289.1 SGNH/GDSL hydrolase family protein [Kaistia algarum]PPE80380.1 hypothetical protein C3941_09480 [Kaistia algarum]
MADPIILPPTRLAETLGAKMRRLARAAEISNPLIRNPWLVPPAWAQSTVQLVSDTCVANGNWYVCATPGTTAASGTGPSHVNGQAVQDGTAYWTYLGAAPITVNEPGAPTLTASTVAPTSPNNVQIFPVGHAALFRYYGGQGEVVSANYHYPYVGDNKAGSRQYGNSVRVGFETDSPVLTFMVPAGSPAPRILIDGRYLTIGALRRASTLTYYTLAFPGLRTWRSVEVEGAKDLWAWYGVLISTSAHIRPPSNEHDITAYFIWDSLGAGSSYGPWLSGNNIPQRIGRRLGWTNVYNMSRGGTGPINTGGGYYTFGERVPQLLAANPDIACFGPPTNDTGQSAASVTAATKAYLQAVRAGSKCPIVQMGVWPRNDANVATTEAAVLAAVQQASDPLGLTFFIPLYDAPMMPIVTGAYNVAKNLVNAALDNSSYMIGGDGTHPAELGIDGLATYTAREIKRTVLPYIR